MAVGAAGGKDSLAGVEQVGEALVGQGPLSLLSGSVLSLVSQRFLLFFWPFWPLSTGVVFLTQALASTSSCVYLAALPCVCLCVSVFVLFLSFLFQVAFGQWSLPSRRVWFVPRTHSNEAPRFFFLASRRCASVRPMWYSSVCVFERCEGVFCAGVRVPLFPSFCHLSSHYELRVREGGAVPPPPPAHTQQRE